MTDQPATRVRQIAHVTVVVDDLEKASAFYEHELGLEPLPVFDLDFPAQFFKVNERQQIHVTEWEDDYSFRGHMALEVADFDSVFHRMKGLDAIDTRPWGKVRRLPDGTMQMFIRDPAGNLIEISAPKSVAVDPAIFEDELVEAGTSAFRSGRDDSRGLRGDGATLYHGAGEGADDGGE